MGKEERVEALLPGAHSENGELPLPLLLSPLLPPLLLLLLPAAVFPHPLRAVAGRRCRLVGPPRWRPVSRPGRALLLSRA